MITKLQVKYIQSLGQKKFRDSEGVFVAEGPKIINEFLATGSAVQTVQIYATGQWINENKILAHGLAASQLIEIKEQELERISFLQTPNEVLGVFSKPVYTTVELNGAISLMLDGIQDPGNMGTIIRIADWFGISNIVCSPDCADAFAPKVIQSTMGSIVRVKLLYTDLVKLAATMPSLPLYAAALNGDDIQRLSTPSEAVIVIGNESKGISDALMHSCQHRITIPRLGKAESLNAAVAAGIILSHITKAPVSNKPY